MRDNSSLQVKPEWSATSEAASQRERLTAKSVYFKRLALLPNFLPQVQSQSVETVLSVKVFLFTRLKWTLLGSLIPRMKLRKIIFLPHLPHLLHLQTRLNLASPILMMTQPTPAASQLLQPILIPSSGTSTTGPSQASRRCSSNSLLFLPP